MTRHYRRERLDYRLPDDSNLRIDTTATTRHDRSGDRLTLRALAAALSRPVRDAQQDTPEDPSTLRKRLKAELRGEVLAELRERIRNPAPKPQPPPQAQHVRAPDQGLDVFFDLAEQQRENRRGS